MQVNEPESMTPWLRPSAERSSVPAEQELTVGEVASLVGVSVRTLHHWDDIGLVSPKDRTSAGYRRYGDADIGRIHRVLVYRELGFSLARITDLLDDPGVDEASQLRQQQRLLSERINRLQSMSEAIDQLLSSDAAGVVLTVRERADLFGQEWSQSWDEEAQGRWGDTQQWAQFEESLMALSEEERTRLHAQGEALYAEMAAAMRAGEQPGGQEANRLAQQHRALIGQMFECTYSMQVIIGRFYTSDGRFRPYFDRFEPGLATWISDAICANAQRHGVDPDNATWR